MKLFVGWKLLLVSILLSAPFFSWAITRIIKKEIFDNNFTYHINQSMSGTDPSKSYEEFVSALLYLQSHNLTSGYTTIVIRSPSEDISIFYDGIFKKFQYSQKLASLPPEEIKQYQEYVVNKNLATTQIKEPEGISIYPYNGIYFVWMLISILLLVLSIIGIFTFMDERNEP